VHNAKGLEFPIVFLAGMEEGLFPHIRSLDSEAQMEEERRLCYVAMTRAEEKLFISFARQRRRFGGSPPEPAIPSRFLKEIPPNLVQNMRDGADVPQVELFSERHEVRETARRNLFTGKTYNSLENVNQFFAERGVPGPRVPAAGSASSSSPPAGAAKAATPPATGTGRTPVAASPQGGQAPPRVNAVVPPVAPRPKPAVPQKGAKGIRAGSTIQHPKYGRGMVLRREGDGDDAKLTVSFPQYGLKKLVEKFAGIQVEE
jgi:DNA helicase-2/ATP-dependent DNA helicase PcrA